MIGNDSVGDPVFADVSYHAGVAETDWSWNPSIADFDNDGNRDIVITNGYPRDVTDHDFVSFRTMSGKIASRETLIEEIPQIKVSNYAYQHLGDLKFANVTKNWGLDEPSFSNGAVYADLDNDGDLDYVVNNINEEAFVYENRLNNSDSANADYIKLRFRGDRGNVDGLGVTATIYYGNKLLSWENAPVRGYLSCVENTLMFGLPKGTRIDSIHVNWPGGHQQTLRSVRSNQTLVVNKKDAESGIYSPVAPVSLFRDVTSELGVDYRHTEKDFIDFNYQRLIPHKFSEYGPGIAVGDINNDGYEDLCIGGTENLPVTFLMQQSNGRYLQKTLPMDPSPGAAKPETQGILLFDADNDADLDLYLVSGSIEGSPESTYYEDRFFENTGKGNFKAAIGAIPSIKLSKSCVKAADIDNDGDLDLFIGGRVSPGRYPEAVNSFIYRNDSQKGLIKFTDITNQAAPGLMNIGLSCDAIFTDFNNDGWKDLVIAGEWAPLKFFKNANGKFVDVTKATGIENHIGWWNSIAGADFDNDGDIDYVAGNLGTNTFYRATEQYPLKIYAGDFANNGGWVAIPSVYLFDSTGVKKEFPAQSRNDIVDQLPALKKKYLTYRAFAGAEMKDLFAPAIMDSSYKRQANFMESAFIENQGNGKFAIKPLPWNAQLAPVFGIITDDFNADGYIDLALSGNDFGAEPAIGRYDAMNGLVLLGDGKGNFKSLSIAMSGIYLPGNAKALTKIRDNKNNYFIAGSQNRDELKIYQKRKTGKLITIYEDDVEIIMTLKDGRKRRIENYLGSSFLSQSSQFIEMTDATQTVEIRNRKGISRIEK